MWLQAAGISLVVLAQAFAGFATGAALLGVGTAMVYPTLLAAIGDVAHPSWRASAVGVYRLWRDLGYALGALLAGVIADALGLPAAMWVVAALTFASGVVVALRMSDTPRPPAAPPAPARPCIELDELARSTNAIIVDVRSADEFAAGHVAGAINVPIDELAARMGELPEGAVIVTVCATGGGRSERAAEQLRARGFHSTRALCGGTQAWTQRNPRGP
jgi:rhodanese-related sulfurtransferase